MEPETLNNPENPKISGLLGISGDGCWNWIPDLDFASQKQKTLQSRKLSLSEISG